VIEALNENLTEAEKEYFSDLDKKEQDIQDLANRIKVFLFLFFFPCISLPLVIEISVFLLYYSGFESRWKGKESM